nr:hypothetical protein [Pandoravirus massiliensis]
MFQNIDRERMWSCMTQPRIRLAATYATLAVVIMGDIAIVAWTLATSAADTPSLVGALVIFDLAAYVYVQVPFAIAHCIRGERGERRLHDQRLDYVLDGDPDGVAKRVRATKRWFGGLRRCGRARRWSPAVPTFIAGLWQDAAVPLGGTSPAYVVHIDRCRRLAKGLYEIRGVGRHAPENAIIRGYANRNNATGEIRLAWASAQVMPGGVVASYRTTGVSLEHRAVIEDTRSPAVIVGASYIVDDDVDDDAGPLLVAGGRCAVSGAFRFVLHPVGIEP